MKRRGTLNYVHTLVTYNGNQSGNGTTTPTSMSFDEEKNQKCEKVLGQKDDEKKRELRSSSWHHRWLKLHRALPPVTKTSRIQRDV